MEVVGHERVAEHPQGQPLVGGGHQVKERREIPVLVKYRSLGITTIQHVVTDSGGRWRAVRAIH